MSVKFAPAKEKGCSLPASMRGMRYGRISYIMQSTRKELKELWRLMEKHGLQDSLDIR